ncbi:unnamed protein product [Effrenium voratum]|nr:unnamed protein product [Effrenium voratum]CAJ1380133.1 unnamed protein product [Effrenium voratum]CAJ1418995.1 unnamed protein product [Effrenium voratum]
MDLARQSADLARQSTTSLAPIQLAPIGLLRDHLVLAMGDVGRFNPQNGTYRLNRAFWECYSKKWGASVLFIDPRRFEKCQLHTDWFFRRVCAVASLVEAFVRDSKENVSETADSFGLPVAPRWIFHLDGDSMLSNLDLPLSDFTVPWDREGKSLVFYERFHNGEIAAGNYALRVSELAAQFLRGWERKVSETKNVKFTNSDNGVLHLHLVWYLQKELSFPQGSLQNASHAWASVLRQFRASKDIGSYDRFVALVKLALGPRRDFKHLLVGRRGHGFCADDWTKMYLSKLHVCHHAVKSAAQLVKMIGQSCIDKSLQCLQGPAVCAPQTEREARVKLRNFKPDRFALGNVNDISSCWPNCTRDIPQAVWGQMAVGLQKNGHCLSPRMACCC